MSFDIILPFLRPIKHLILDEDISEIMVNGSGAVFIERRGQLLAQPDVTLNEESLAVAVRNMARTLGDDINDEKPVLDSRLPDGSRVAAVLPPCSVGGITLTIRKFHSHRWTLDELIRTGAIPPEVVDHLSESITQHKNILISGGTGTGKTTMLNALASRIPSHERLVVIEDTAEIQINTPNLVRFEARREQPSLPAVTIRDLLKATLRHRPDRIILGEIRGGEAFDLLQALNTGHSGSLSTIHANSARQALGRFASCVLQSGVELPFQAVQMLIAESVHNLLHIERRHGRRQVAELARVEGYDLHTNTFAVKTIYSREIAPIQPAVESQTASLAALRTQTGESVTSTEPVVGRRA